MMALVTRVRDDGVSITDGRLMSVVALVSGSGNVEVRWPTVLIVLILLQELHIV